MDSQTFLTSFIKIVEQHPVLYDPKLPSRTPHLLSVTWEKVTQKVKHELKEEYTVEELKTKWKGIRSSFSRYTRMVGRSGEKGTKQYYLYDVLKFLLPHTTRKPRRRYSEAERHDDQSSDADEWDSEMVHIFSDDAIEHTNNTTSDSLAIPLHSNSLAYPEIKLERNDDEHAVDITNVVTIANEDDSLPVRDTSLKRKIFNTYEAPASKAQKIEENADLQFFKSILPDISHFANFEKRKFKVGVLKLIDDIENSRQDIRFNNKPSDKFN